MTVSPAKLAANCANGAMSSGPKTSDGKVRSSANAIKHGLCSRRMVLPGESPDEFLHFRALLWADLNPHGAVQEFLVERVVGCAWRLRRVVRIENEAIERAGNNWRMANQKRMNFELTRGGVTTMLGLSYEATGASTLDSLARHEARLERSLARALHEFQRLRAGVVPFAVDVDVAAGTDAVEAPHELDADAFDAKFESEERDVDRGAPPTLAELCSPELRGKPVNDP